MEDFSKDIENCLNTLREGGLILYPTDTIWGIGCDATNEEAVQKIYRLKKREESKSMIVLLADERELLRWVAGPDPRIFDYLKTVSKPTTVIYDGAIGLASNLVGPDGSIAIRLTRDHFCRELIRRFRRPVVSTSANISGEPPPRNFSEIPNLIIDSVDYAAQYRRNDTNLAQASSIIRWNNDGSITNLRG